jgi:hypothetical protein
MKCPNCSTVNDDEYVFCVNCGFSFNGPQTVRSAPFPTETYPEPVHLQSGSTRPQEAEIETLVKPLAQLQPSDSPPTDFPRDYRRGRRTWPIILGVCIFLLTCLGIAAGLLINRPTSQTELLPDHLGLFAANKEGNHLVEIRRQDLTNALTGAENLLKDETLPDVEETPELLLYAESTDVPLSNLRAVVLDSIKADGTVKEIDFQASLVEGKPAIKRLRFPSGLPTGKFAFVLFDGFLDEGKHRLWAFQVRSSSRIPSPDLTRIAKLSVKSVEPGSNTNSQPGSSVPVHVVPVQKPAISLPVGSRVAFCNATDVLVRKSPSLTARQTGRLNRGQKVFVIQYSANYDNWNGTTANWALIQTESGKRGWVFTPFIGY